MKRNRGTPSHPTRDRGSYSGHPSFMECFRCFGTKPQIENKEKIMPPVLTRLVNKDIIELFEETWENRARNNSRYPKILAIGFKLTCYRSEITIQINVKWISLNKLTTVDRHSQNDWWLKSRRNLRDEDPKENRATVDRHSQNDWWLTLKKFIE